MTKIMFVCHGNICRSPMAEFIMKKLVSDRGLSDNFLIRSSATSTEEIWNGVGSPIHPDTKATLSANNIPYTERRAVLLDFSDYSRYDVFVCMDSRNMRNIRRIFPSDPDSKIKMLMDFTERGGEVSDPYYTGNFEKTYRDIYDGCRALLEFLGEKANLG